MSAIDKTKKIRRIDLPLAELEVHPDNPNRLVGRQFDLLVDNVQRTGITDPILVRPMPNGKYQIVSGHHRAQVAEYLGFDQVPCTVIDDPEFGDEETSFQLVRMNIIRGKMDPAAFFTLYEQLAGKYPDDVMQEMMGFAESKDFAKLINQTAKSLPAELQGQFKEAAKEIKTIEGLSKLLNEMFSKHGSSLPFGYMIFDNGGHRQVWLQCSKKTLSAVQSLGVVCRDNKRTMDDLVGSILQLIANGDTPELLAKAVSASKPVVFPDTFDDAPTIENLAAYASM